MATGMCCGFVRGRIAVVEDDMRQTYTVKHIRNGLTLLRYELNGKTWF